MTRDEMLADIAYARTLAEEGRHAPLLGGSYLLFWGVLNAGAFAGHYSIGEGFIAASGGSAYGVLWLGYGAVALLGMVLLRMRSRGKPGVAAIGTRAERALWSGAATALLAVAIGSIARMFASSDPNAPNAIFGAGFALYGAALFGTASLSEQAWLRAFGWLAVSVAGTLCLFANESWAYVVAAIGSILVLAVPGIVLLRREPSAIV
ncbi:MAG: hypothetical protein KF779_00795 [Hyphomonadaceae bacterium]|nr:hypothetical protein [Hyphomonadaceae bacterium]MCA8886322.1 hypothetical protein [Hyphomonadaceae bacterium]